MDNLARGDYYDKSGVKYDRSITTNKCCICQAPIKIKSNKDDGICPNEDCARETFFKEAYGMLDNGRWDKFLRSTA